MKYNKLTKKLISEGYTAEDYPEYVKVGGHGAVPVLDNYEGGFLYKSAYLLDKTFKAPCGILCRHGSTFDNLFYNGFEYTYENDLALIHCPKHCEGCKKRHEGIRDGSEGLLESLCAVSMTDEPYRYEGSLEELNDLHDRKIQAEKEEFLRTHKACESHMRYMDDHWEYSFDPMYCAKTGCLRISSGDCPLFAKDREKGNVFYDVVIKYTSPSDVGTLFEGKVYTEITKGKQLFDSARSMTICKIAAKTCQDKILQREKEKYSQRLFFAEYHPDPGNYFEVSIQNVHAEKRETRNLEQDIADMAAGIKVYHHKDITKAAKLSRANRQKELADKKKTSLRKKLIKTGYDNLDEYSIDKKHADKWFTEAERADIEKERSTIIGAGAEQMDIFDLLD